MTKIFGGRIGNHGVLARAAVLGTALLSLHCADDRGETPAATATEGAPLLSQTVHAGEQSDVFVQVPPSSHCQLTGDGLEPLALHADSRGVVAFFVSVNDVGNELDVALSCANSASPERATRYPVRVSAVADEVEPFAPSAWLKDLPYQGRVVQQSEDPEKMTVSRLTELGLPAKPDRAALPEAYASWLTEVSTPIVQIETDVVGTGLMNNIIDGSASANWCGFETGGPVTGVTNPAYGVVAASWPVPKVVSGRGTAGTYYSSIWPGIGGFEHPGTGTGLKQGGTEQQASCNAFACTGTYYAWVEYVPDQELQLTNMTVSSGDVIAVSVTSMDQYGRFDPRGLSAQIVVNNTTRHTSVTKFLGPPVTLSTFYADGVEWIFERPTLPPGSTAPAKLTKLPDFTVSDSLAKVYDNGAPLSVHTISYGDSGLTSENIPMWNGSHQLASVAVGTKTATGQKMTFHWMNYN